MRKHDDLMAFARRVDPIPPERFHGFATSPAGRRILDAIVDEAIPRGKGVRPTSPGPRAARKRVLAGVAVAAAVLGVVAVGTSNRPRPREDSSWAPKLVRVAQEAPRLLVVREGWIVASADEIGGDTGEMIFESDRRWVTLNWFPAELYEGYVEDRRRGADAAGDVTVAGRDGILFRHDGTAPSGVTFYALWLDGPHAMELRSDVIPAAGEFRALAASLEAVDVDTWLAALPDDVVTPDRRDDAVETILADVPIPSNLDVEELKKRQAVRTAASLEYEVTMAVVCGWVQQWVDATRSGDDAAKSEAVEMLGAARRWDVLRDLGQGATYVFDVADAMAAGTPVNDDRSLPTGVGYQRHIGCPER